MCLEDLFSSTAKHYDTADSVLKNRILGAEVPVDVDDLKVVLL